MSKNKGGREVRKPKQVKTPKADSQSTPISLSQVTDRGKSSRSK